MTSVLALIPVAPKMHPALKARINELVGAMLHANPTIALRVVFDDKPEPRQTGDYTAWSKVTRVRNRMLDEQPWRDFDYLMWVDSDLVDFAPDLPTRLTDTADGGIAAPLVLIEGSDRFYDVTAFIEAGSESIAPQNPARIPGRNLSHNPPYWLLTPTQDVVPMDCVGAVYVCHTDVLKTGVRHEDHPSYTDHYPICAKAREMGRRVVCDRRLKAYHADLPKYGMKWN